MVDLWFHFPIESRLQAVLEKKILYRPNMVDKIVVEET